MAIIKNKDQLSTTTKRTHALSIIEAGITAVSPQSLIRKSISYDPEVKKLKIQQDQYDLSSGQLFIVGAGKAAYSMVQALETIIPDDHITDGVVSCTKTGPSKKVRVVEAGHPYPDQNGVDAVRQMFALKETHQINKNDVVLCLLSGGGSALMPLSPEGIRLKDVQKTFDLLIKSGASIQEINTVRKHISKVKGGKLGAHFAPSRVISLIISDIVGNNVGVIASGPTAPDSTTFEETWNVLKKFSLINLLPSAVRDHVKKGRKHEIHETPKKLNNCHNYIIGDNEVALEAMKEKAEELGYNPVVTSKQLTGETTDAAKNVTSQITNGQYDPYNAIILGGETTPHVPKNHGKGGRNQHYIAVAMMAMSQYPHDWLAASVATDGHDYIPEVAGAVADKNSLERVKQNNIDPEKYINTFDTYNLFKESYNSHIETGSTGTNVGDVVLYLI